MERQTTQELMNQLTDRLLLDLKEDEIACPKCKGLRFVYEQRGEYGSIGSCNECYNGKQYVCKYCGKSNKTDHCDCDGSIRERQIKEQEKELERFNKAEKINFKDYNGYFLWNDRAIDGDDLSEELYNSLHWGEDVPTYLYATKKEYVSIGVDIYEEISNNCSDGYEDMVDYVDMRSEKLKQAQDLIDKWVEEQGETTAIYYEDYSKVVLLNDLVDELIRQDLVI